MLASISILLYNKCEITRRFLQHLDSTLPNKGSGIEFIFTNNGSNDDSESYVFQSRLKNKVYVPYGLNMGFPWAHTQALRFASSPYFFCLNNDMILHDPQWIHKMILCLEEAPNIAIVGLENTPCSLRNDGSGYVGPNKEYVEASCLAGRTELFRKYGLFSPSMQMFFYEDSDLSLRYRQMGYDIAHLPIKHDHVRGQTVNTIEKGSKRKIVEHNRDVFLKRWAGYLARRSFTNKILVRALSHGGGDIIAVTPVLEGLRRDHPKADIEVETNWPDVFEKNPYVTSIHKPRNSYDHGFDRIIQLDLDYSSYNHICTNASNIAATTIESNKPQLFLNGFELSKGQEIVDQLRENEDDTVIGICLQMERSGWKGRSWRKDYIIKLISILRQFNIKIIEIGKGVESTGLADLDLVNKTTVREMFSIVANLDILVCVDSMILHVAQAFSTPTFALFGATEPISRVTDFSTVSVIRNESLPCLGCYQKKGKSDYNKCFLNNEECMMSITPETVADHVVGNINGLLYNIKYLEDMKRRKLNEVIPWT